MFARTLCRPAVRPTARPVATPRARAVAPAAPRAPRAARGLAMVAKAGLTVGQRLDDNPDYFRVLKASDGSGVALSSFQGKKPVVLAFYPKASTPGCTKQMCRMRDGWQELQATGAAVFGISSDDPATNAAFAKAQNLPFPLLTDASGFLRKSFGIKGDMMGLLPGRETIVIDKDSTVLCAFNSQFSIDEHLDEALAALKKVKA